MATWNQVNRVLSDISQIRLLTWNVHGCTPPTDLAELLGTNKLPLPEIYAIGLQEVGSDQWDRVFLSFLRDYDYVKVKSRRLLGIVTMLFVKRSHLPFVCNIESEVTKTGFKGCWGNKGAASVRLDFMGMNLIIVNSHLAAHQEGIKDRIMNIDDILDGQKFRDPDTDNIMDHDYVFWIGDLNFRLENMSYNRALDLIRDANYKTLINTDQLHLIMEEGLVFDGFQEGELNFPPTYKFDKGTDNYDTSLQKRIPSYTDRILFHYHDTYYGKMKLKAKAIEYLCHQNYKSSDHKPVTALVNISVMNTGISGPIHFQVSREPWSKHAVNDVVYTVRKDFKTSVWDWIGIYKANFADFNAHLTYVWTSSSTMIKQDSSVVIQMTVQFNTANLSSLPDGDYVLCYLTRKGSLCGISRTFIIGTR